MSKVITRIFVVLLAITLGTTLFIILTFAGDRSKGPLSDLFREIEYNVANMEKRVIGHSREKRNVSLKWFNAYRTDTNAITNPDIILLGAYDDKTVETYEPIIAMEDSLEVDLPIIHFYTAWGSRPTQVFPFLRAQAIWDLGSIPMITWEPWLDDFDKEEYPELAEKENPNKDGMNLILSGYFDDYIDRWAQAAADFGHSFYLRFAHEMNDPYRYPWGPPNNTSAAFIEAWQYVHDRFEKAGATNVVWVWSPHPAYKGFGQYYPGEAYIDWIGVTTLNYGTVASWSRWWSFDNIISNSYGELKDYGQPIMLTEFGSLPVGGDRAQWFENALQSMPEKYPVIRSVVFFHVHSDNTTSYKTLDWSFINDSATVSAIKKSIKSWQE